MACDLSQVRVGDRLDTGPNPGGIQRTVTAIYPDGAMYIRYGDGSHGLRPLEFMQGIASNMRHIRRYPSCVALPDGL